MADTTTTTTTETSGNSEPPAVRIINARGLAVQLVLAQLAELAGLGVVTYALSIGKLTSTEFLGGFAYCLGGNMVGKIRGKTAVPLTMMLATAAPAALKAGALAVASRVAMVGLALTLVFAPLPGCGLFPGGGVTQCAVAPLPALLDDVLRILENGSGPLLNPAELAQLEALGVKYGAAAVECAVRQVIADLTGHGAQASPERLGAAERGRDYLRRKAVQP